MTSKPRTKAKPKLTDAERHKRFVVMAREVDASESPKAFDKAFRRVVLRAARASKSGQRSK